MKTLEQERDDVRDSAKQIIDSCKSASRDPNASETKALNTKLAEIKSLNERIELSEQGQAALRAFGQQPDAGMTDGPGYGDFSASGLKRLAGRFAEKMVGVEASGRKALLPAGETGLSISVTPSDPVAQAHAELSLLSVLPLIPISQGANATYIRQNTRTLNAAAVAPGDLKPTSTLALLPVPVKLKVYATLSDPTDRFLIEDAAVLSKFIASELLYGVSTAVEADVLNGNPSTSPAAIRGLLQTSGIVTVAFTTDLLTSLRAAKTSAETLGYADSLIYAMSAADFAAAELARASTGGTFDFPTSPTSAAPLQIWGIPVVIVHGLPAKTAVLINRTSVAMYIDTLGLRCDWGTVGDGFAHNSIVARAEGRLDLAVYQPNAIVKIGTAA